MPITYEIDHARRIVFTQANGILTEQDFFTYQKEVWPSPRLRGYDECIDMSAVTTIEGATDKNIKLLAELSARTDEPSLPTKLAIIANEDLHFGLARMYEAYRSMQKNSSRKVAVVRTRDEALRWLTQVETAP